MNKENTKKAIAGGLLVLIPIVFAWQFGMFSGSKTPPPSTQAKPATPASTAPAAAQPAATAAAPTPANQKVDLDQLLAKVQEVNFLYVDKMIARDPMAPVIPTPPEDAMIEDGEGEGGVARYTDALQHANQMKLTGIMWSEQKPVAVLDNVVVSPGYTFKSGVVVQSIERKRVELMAGDTPVEKKLEPQKRSSKRQEEQ